MSSPRQTRSNDWLSDLIDATAAVDDGFLITATGATWLADVQHRAFGFAAYATHVVEGVRTGVLPLGQLPDPSPLRDRLLERRGLIQPTSDDPWQLLHVLVAQAGDQVVAREAYAAMTSPQLVESALQQGADERVLAPFCGGVVWSADSAWMQEYVLAAPHLESARSQTASLWLEHVFGGDADLLSLDFGALAARLDVASAAWLRFSASRRFLERLAVRVAGGRALQELATWSFACGEQQPPSLDAWLTLLRRCGAPHLPERKDAVDFLLDRVLETERGSSLRTTLETHAPLHRPGRRQVGAPCTDIRFVFPRSVVVAALGERAQHVAVLLDDGRLCVDDVRTGCGVVAPMDVGIDALDPQHATLAVSDTLRCVVVWSARGASVTLLWFTDAELCVERLTWRLDRTIRYAGLVAGPLDLPDGLLSVLSGRSAAAANLDLRGRWPGYGQTVGPRACVRSELNLLVAPEDTDPRIVRLSRADLVTPRPTSVASVDSQPLRGWTVKLEDDGFRLRLLDPGGIVQAEWWGPRELQQPRLLAPDLVEVGEGVSRTLLCFELPS